MAKVQAEWQRATSRLEARHEYWSIPADERQERANADSETRQNYSDDRVTAGKDFQHAAADNYFTECEALSQANYDYDIAEIGNRFLLVSGDSNSYAYWGQTYSDYATSINNEGDRQQASIAAQHAYHVAMQEISQASATQQSDLAKALNDDLRDAWVNEQQDLAEGLAEFQKAAAQADKAQAVKLILDQGVERKANALAHVTFVIAQSGADKTFTQSQASAAKSQNNADAIDGSTFQATAATAFLQVIGNWSSANLTPWTGYQYDLALAEQGRAIAVGDANVTFVSATNTAEHIRTVVTSGAERL